MAAEGGFQILSLSNYAPIVRDYKKLKTHQKSRSGCVACKEKRVKVCMFLTGLRWWDLVFAVRRGPTDMPTMSKERQEVYLRWPPKGTDSYKTEKSSHRK